MKEVSMYGTMFKARPKSGKFQDLMDVSAREWKERGNIAGFRHAFVLQESNGDVWTMVIFDSEEAYRKNSESPEQDKWFRERRALLEADPEWHDGTIIEDKP
jgi:quinol monooxygenase YgiN